MQRVEDFDEVGLVGHDGWSDGRAGNYAGSDVFLSDYLLIDEAGRTCRKDWHVDVRRGRSESKVKVGMPADTVWDYGLRGSRRDSNT